MVPRFDLSPSRCAWRRQVRAVFVAGIDNISYLRTFLKFFIMLLVPPIKSRIHMTKDVIFGIMKLCMIYDVITEASNFFFLFSMATWCNPFLTEHFLKLEHRFWGSGEWWPVGKIRWHLMEIFFQSQSFTPFPLFVYPFPIFIFFHPFSVTTVNWVTSVSFKYLTFEHRAAICVNTW